LSAVKKFLNKKNENPNAEMGFLDHIEALRWHIVRSAIAVIIGGILIFIKVEWIFDRIILGPAHNDFVTYRLLCKFSKIVHIDSLCLGDIQVRLQNTSVTGQFMMSMSVSMMLGFICTFPYIFWEFWKFIKPALKPSEVQMARGIVFWCSLLFFLGVAFSYYVVMPYTVNFFGNYKISPIISNNFTIDNYYEIMSNMTLALGVVFELPMLVYFLTRIGILTPEFLRAKRRYAFLLLFVLAIIIAPPDVFSCLIVFIPLYILFEISVGISGRAVKARKLRQALKAQQEDND
jgi:sec-independent protein translocase protein TatC